MMMSSQTGSTRLALGLAAVHLSMTMISPEQCRAVRAWLDISQSELASAAGVSEDTIRKFERRDGSRHRGSILLIHTAIERLGFRIGENKLELPPRE